MSSPASLFSRKLPPRYNAVVFPLILTMMMTFVVSLISTLIGFGLQPGVIGVWGKAWIASWIIAFPALLMIMPLVRRIVAMLVEQPTA